MNFDRSTRGSLLFVGTFNDELVSSIEQPVRCVYTIFDAIGELATCSAADLIEAIIVDDQLLNNNSKETFEAIRRVDPTTMIIVAGESETPRQVDAVVPKTTTAARLSSAIANVISQPKIPEISQYVDLDAVLGINDETVFVKDSSPLGDIDLVRSLMHDPTHFTEVLVSMMRQQTGWKYCGFVDDETCAPEQTQVAPIRYGHEEHGALAAIGASAQDLARWARWAACWLELARRQRHLKLLAYQDELSGAWNRRFLQTCLKKELKIAKASRRPLTVMVFDIDNFKYYNDRFGHDAGDEIIREIVLLLRIILRKGDHVCRTGGDEFTVIFCDPEPPREAGSNHPTTVEVLAKRFHEQVSKTHFPKLGEGTAGVLSISGGLASFPWDGIDADTILRKADERLLHSKRQGKNSITIGHH